MSFTRILSFIEVSVVAGVFSTCADVVFESACVGLEAASLEQAANRRKINGSKNFIKMLV